MREEPGILRKKTLNISSLVNLQHDQREQTEIQQPKMSATVPPVFTSYPHDGYTNVCLLLY